MTRGRHVAALAAAAALSALFGGHASAARAAGSQSCDKSAYALSLLSLTTPPRADLTIRITARKTACALPLALRKVEVTILSKGSVQRRLQVADVAAPGATTTLRLGRVLRYQRVAATISFDPQISLRGQTRTLLRPDLVLKAVKVPRTVVTGRPFSVAATIRQRTRDLGMTAVLTVAAGPTVLVTRPVRVAPRRNAVFRLPTTLQTPGRTRLTVTVTAPNPIETATRNNVRRVVVEATEFKVVPSSVIVPKLAGYGSQFNHHVYAAISRAVGVTDENVADMESKMRALHPEFSRIFFTPAAFTDPDRMQSFIRTVLLAQSTGTTINITWQGGTLDVKSGTIQKFADVLIDLVQNRGVSLLKWLTLQNEPNRTRITPQQYEARYRELDPYIQQIRGQVRYMGGDLVRGPDAGPPNQQVWFDYMATHMADILDAYSIHVYWDFWDTQKLVARLTEVRAIVDALPKAARKPLYVSEFGVRGLRTFNGVAQTDPGVWTDGTPITQTNVSAFQHAWFDILSARLGYLGTSKWDSYYAMYDNAKQAYYMIGDPASGWPLFPLYNFFQLMTATVKRDWKVVAVDSAPGGTRLLTAYVGSSAQRTVVGLDTAGAQLNGPSPTSVSYTIGGLPPSQTLRLAVWNQAGDGLVPPAGTVSTDAAGVVTFPVPQQSVFVLTTLRLA